jgi:predicted RND superfamily exporter protein
VVTKNSILIIDYAFIAMREQGLSEREALLDACHKRARPVMMTTVAMVAGMLPLALGFGGDASFRQPMAIAVIGGLIASTALSLIVVTVVSTYVTSLESGLGRLFAGEHREVCAIEELYARVARSAGIDLAPSRFFDLGAKHSAFGVERFDCVVQDRQVIRVPVLSMSAMLQADHRLPLLDYETILLATLRITGDQREVLKAFERCLFNVVMHNRDDHSRNFAFRLNEQDLWKLSPAFDLTYSFGPAGEHATSIAGQGERH